MEIHTEFKNKFGTEFHIDLPEIKVPVFWIFDRIFLRSNLSLVSCSFHRKICCKIVFYLKKSSKQIPMETEVILKKTLSVFSRENQNLNFVYFQ